MSVRTKPTADELVAVRAQDAAVGFGFSGLFWLGYLLEHATGDDPWWTAGAVFVLAWMWGLAALLWFGARSLVRTGGAS